MQTSSLLLVLCLVLQALSLFQALLFQTPAKRLPQLTFPEILSSSATLVAPFAMRDQQDMQAVLILVGNHDVQVRVGLVAAGFRRPPAQQTCDAPDVRVDGEGFPLQAEQQHARGGFGPDTLKAQQFRHGGFTARRVQVVE